MITAIFDYNRKTFECSLIVKGHASFAEIGTDIVCASASMLTYTLAKMVMDMYEKGKLMYPPVIRLEGGDACVSCDCRSGKLYNAFETIRTGFELLAENYPQNVNVKA